MTPGFEPGDGEVTDESSARWFADRSGALRHLVGHGVEPGRGDHEHAIGEHVDGRSEHHLRRSAPPTVHRVDHVARFGLTQETEGDVPVLGPDETHAALGPSAAAR